MLGLKEIILSQKKSIKIIKIQCNLSNCKKVIKLNKVKKKKEIKNIKKRKIKTEFINI